MNDYEYLKRSYYLQVTGNPAVWNTIILFLVLIIIGFFTWAFFTKVDEISYATGKIIPSANIVKIQHHESAEISEIYLKNGQKVRKGDTLIKFNTEIYKLRKNEHLDSLQGLRKRKDLYTQQLDIRKKLYKEGLNSKMAYLGIQNQLNDTEIEIKRLEKELEIIEKKLERSTIYSPIDGTIHNLQVHNSLEVVNGGFTILEIYPDEQALIAEIRISPDDIGHITVGQNVTIKLLTYDYSRYGGLSEKLLEISESTYINENNEPFYKGLVSITHNTLKNKKLPILPGMTLSAEIKTGEKSILTYLFKPVYYITDHAMSER